MAIFIHASSPTRIAKNTHTHSTSASKKALDKIRRKTTSTHEKHMEVYLIFEFALAMYFYRHARCPASSTPRGSHVHWIYIGRWYKNKQINTVFCPI